MIKQISTYNSECSSCSNSESSSLISSYSSCSSVKNDDNKDDNYPQMSARAASRYFLLMHRKYKTIFFNFTIIWVKEPLFLYYRKSEVDIDITLDVDSNDDIKAGKNFVCY